MNKKAEAFIKYLDDKKITCFAIEQISEDKLNTVAFRSHIVVEGQRLPTLAFNNNVRILDSSIYGMLRVQLAANAVNETNEVAILREINKVNRQYKVFKYYLTNDGSLYLDSCLLCQNGRLEGDMIYTVLDVIIKHLEKEYKKIMQLIWQAN